MARSSPLLPAQATSARSLPQRPLPTGEVESWRYSCIPLCTVKAHAAAQVGSALQVAVPLLPQRRLAQQPAERHVRTAAYQPLEDDSFAASANDMTEARIIVVTSGKGGVGKTTTSANLGMSIARLGYKAGRSASATKTVHISSHELTFLSLALGSILPGLPNRRRYRAEVRAVAAAAWLSTCCRLLHRVQCTCPAAFARRRNLDLLLGLENRILYTAIDILDGECRLDQALIRDKVGAEEVPLKASSATGAPGASVPGGAAELPSNR